MKTYRCGNCDKIFYHDGYESAIRWEEFLNKEIDTEEFNSRINKLKSGDFTDNNRPPIVCPHCGAQFTKVKYVTPDSGKSSKKNLIILLVIIVIIYIPLFFIFRNLFFSYFESWPFGQVLAFAAILLMDLVIVLMMMQPVNYRVRY